MAWTNSFHHLYWNSMTVDVTSTRGTLDFGIGYYSLFLYQAALSVVALGLLVKKFVNPKATYRKQVLALILSAVFPWAGGVAYLATPI
ncbi:MAG: histidine kinase N-terminal 7TM domain-containing protein, partial [Halobacteria archaeon]|nr:histidine kinase N-terminal 7TM domain-containing protein [Halobacteria archaeon]